MTPASPPRTTAETSTDPTDGAATDARGPSPADLPKPVVLYVGASLPSRSETFVYRELLALRDIGWTVHAASVHAPQHNLGDPTLDALASEAIPLYSRGPRRLLTAAAAEFIRRPGRALSTLATAGGDATRAEPRPPLARLKILWQAVAGLALASNARRLRVAHIHAHMAHVPATIATYAARQLGVPFSFTGHANDIFRERTLLAQKLRRAAFVACISEWHRGVYREALGPNDPAADDRRMPVVRCGVDPARFAPTPPADREPGLIVSVGRLVPKKGFDLLLRAVAALDGTPCRCAIAGDGSERARLEKLRDELGLQDRVELLGAVSNETVRGLLSRASLFALACRQDSGGDRDGIPVVLMEAMACGVPVVSGDFPAIRELVDGTTGLLAPPEDIDALAAALRRLLTDTELRESVARNARARVTEEFATSVNAQRLADAVGRAAPEPAAVRATL